jgi:dihydrodipicolinate synthase/N-acetylneuraminate lyase
MNTQQIRDRLFEGIVIPAIPLALHKDGSFDPLHQKALLRYYIDSGAGGIAAAVHTTQFEIRDNQEFFTNFLSFVSEEIDSFSEKKGRKVLKIGGVCGETSQAVAEAKLLHEKGFDAGLISLSAFKGKNSQQILAHCREVADYIPLFGFYLQPAVGGVVLNRAFWKEFCQIQNVVGIKVAPFNRYRTLDVLHAVAASGRRHKIALYTGNDDSIIFDLITQYPFQTTEVPIEFAGGLLGQWCVWTKAAVDLLDEIKMLKRNHNAIPFELIQRAQKLTDANAAVFDAQNGFSGVIPGIHEILVRQGLLTSRRCIDPAVDLSDGQLKEIDRVINAYPELQDNIFIQDNIEQWLK